MVFMPNITTNHAITYTNTISISYQKPHVETEALGLILNSLIHVIHEEKMKLASVKVYLCISN